jgi:hypothetical protein
MFVDSRTLQRRRDRLLRGAVRALALTLIAFGLGFISSLTEALTATVAPKPDYYRILVTELARQHFLATNTPTVVREEARTLEFFERQYNVRNEHLGLPAATVAAPGKELLSFSYLAGVMDLKRTLEEVQRRQATNPSATLAMYPLSLWVYSKQEGLMACFSCVIVSSALLNNPPPWLDPNNLLTVDWRDVVSAEGSLPGGEFMFTPVVADLLPFGDLSLEKLDLNSKEDPDLIRFDYMLPLAYLHGSKVAPPHVSGKETVERLRSAAAFPFFLIRRSFRLLILPSGLFWLFRRLWGLSELRRQYCLGLAAKTPATQSPVRIGFFRFLTSRDLEGWMAKAIAGARTEQYLILARQREESERGELIDELEEYRKRLELADEEAGRFDGILSGGSTDELRGLRDRYRPVIERQTEELERERQRLRERGREIQWLESELETLPLEKRENEAREAWALYELAQAAHDQREKLYWLKDARKKLPRELKPDRF